MSSVVWVLSLHTDVVPRGGVEPPSSGFSDQRSDRISYHGKLQDSLRINCWSRTNYIQVKSQVLYQMS